MSDNNYVREDDRISIQVEYPFWYSFKDVWQFRREHILFVIAYANMLADGKYPPEHRETGYTDNGTSTRNQASPFDKAVSLLAEVCRRLDKCGVKEGTPGDLLWHDVTEQFCDPALMVEPNAPTKDNPFPKGVFRLRPSAVKALAYCCGREARLDTFRDWKYKQKRQNVGGEK